MQQPCIESRKRNVNQSCKSLVTPQGWRKWLFLVTKVTLGAHSQSGESCIGSFLGHVGFESMKGWPKAVQQDPLPVLRFGHQLLANPGLGNTPSSTGTLALRTDTLPPVAASHCSATSQMGLRFCLEASSDTGAQPATL